MTMNYSDPDDAVKVEVTSFDNPNHIQLPPQAGSNKKFDSSTYNKKDRLDNRFVCKETSDIIWISQLFLFHLRPDSAPPLPPHGVILASAKNDGKNLEYRPPVPPHRNIGITATNKVSEPI